MSTIDKQLDSFQKKQAEDYVKSWAEKNKTAYIDLVNYPIVYDVLQTISKETAVKSRVIPYLKVGKKIKIATDQPRDKSLLSLLQDLKSATGFDYEMAVCSKHSLQYGLKLYDLYATRPRPAGLSQIKTDKGRDFSKEIASLMDLKEKISQVPATNLLEVLFSGALVAEASDIHLEPTEKDLRVRYRIDGVLQDVARLPLASHHVLASRIKYLAQLKLDIISQPQDGRFGTTTDGGPLDVRVSTLPTAFGETIEMRLLPRNKKFLSLSELGFNQNQLKLIQDSVKKPHGIIFNTGPTGSGKTTTLYAILSELNKPGVKIVTLEDPIEYRILGVDQSQVEPEAGYTFASGLRAVLRQDPDIIMVGEIRDKGTAEIAMHAAMTGHLVLTTLHTNGAAAAIPRLLDMGVPDYLLAGTINLIIAQRLVRKTCRNCLGRGCDVCNSTGYRGRVVITELLTINKEIEELIKQKGTVSQFEEAAKRAGMITMEQDGLTKAQAGLTTKEEINRVTQD